MSDKETFSGEVAWFDPNKGFGFIVWTKNGTKQKDMFVHFSDIICNGFKTLDKDDKVSFEVGSNLKGDPKAINVNITEKAKKQK